MPSGKMPGCLTTRNVSSPAERDSPSLGAPSQLLPCPRQGHGAMALSPRLAWLLLPETHHRTNDRSENAEPKRTLSNWAAQASMRIIELENRCTGNRTVGSNPTLSAISLSTKRASTVNLQTN